MKRDEQIKALLADNYTKINEIRKLMAKISKPGKLAELDENLVQQLHDKERKLRTIYKSKQANFEPVLNGFLALGGKPGEQNIKDLADLNTDVILTLLKKKEKGVQEIEKAVNDTEMKWIWFPLSASELNLRDDFRLKFNELLDDVIIRLKLGERIFVHCAAGIHRTGSFTNALLQKIGYSPSESKELIYKIRPVTAIEAIPKHWAWSGKVIL